MKKWITLWSSLLLVCLLLAGCTSQAESETLSDGEEQGLQIVTTVFPAYDFARAVAGEYADCLLYTSSR